MRCRDIVVLLAVLAAPAYGDDHLDRLAEFHFKAGEYYRAITDYEEIALFATDDATRAHALIRIATSYHHGHQLADAVAAYRRALAAVPDADTQQALRIQIAIARAERTFDEPGAEGLDAIAAELQPSTTGGAHRARAIYELARIEALHGDPTAARATLATCIRPCPLAATLEHALARPSPGHRSAALAIAMSAVVPGSGSVYGGHLVDGIYYFGLTVLPALGAWDVHDSSRRWSDQKTTFYALTTLAALFYAANIFSAYVSTERYNAITDLDARRALWSATDQPWPLD